MQVRAPMVLLRLGPRHQQEHLAGRALGIMAFRLQPRIRLVDVRDAPQVLLAPAVAPIVHIDPAVRQLDHDVGPPKRSVSGRVAFVDGHRRKLTKVFRLVIAPLAIIVSHPAQTAKEDERGSRQAEQTELLPVFADERGGQGERHDRQREPIPVGIQHIGEQIQQSEDQIGRRSEQRKHDVAPRGRFSVFDGVNDQKQRKEHPHAGDEVFDQSEGEDLAFRVAEHVDDAADQLLQPGKAEAGEPDLPILEGIDPGKKQNVDRIADHAAAKGQRREQHVTLLFALPVQHAADGRRREQRQIQDKNLSGAAHPGQGRQNSGGCRGRDRAAAFLPDEQTGQPDREKRDRDMRQIIRAPQHDGMIAYRKRDDEHQREQRGIPQPDPPSPRHEEISGKQQNDHRDRGKHADGKPIIGQPEEKRVDQVGVEHAQLGRIIPVF